MSRFKAKEVTLPVLVHGPWTVQSTSMGASQCVDGRFELRPAKLTNQTDG
jgi:hypothetical protein